METERISFAESENSEFISNYEEDIIDTQIEISINSIENVIRNDSCIIKIIVQHQDIILGESELIKINSSYKSVNTVHPIDFRVGLPYTSNSSKSIAPLVSSPVLIQVFQVLQDNISEKNSNNQCKKSMEKSRTNSKNNQEILGMCNIDIISIILGDTKSNEKLLLQIPSYTWDSTVSWENLPRISVTLQQDETKIIMHDMKFNLFNITIESIYNLPTCFTKDMIYKCGTVIYPHKDVKESCIIFETDKWTNFPDIERRKSWRPLQNLENRARLSNYKISCDYNTFPNKFENFNLKSTVESNMKRIEWNSMHRSFLNQEDIRHIQDRLKKYKYWPFEIMITEKQDKSEAKIFKNTNEVIYQCYVDISQLLFPGRKKTRVLAQLHLQNMSDMKNKTGLDKSIFRNDILDKCKSESDSQISSSGCPVFTENGEPVLILIEFELYQPFFPARILEDFTSAIEILKNKPKPKEKLYIWTPDLTQEQYINCIKHLCDVLGECYRDFSEHCDCDSQINSKNSDSEGHKPKCYSNLKKLNKHTNASSITSQDISYPYSFLKDDLSRFIQFLHETGKYASIHSTLKNKIINLLDQKFPINSSDWFLIENQDFMCSCYTYLVEQMHIALNTKFDVRLNDETSEFENAEELWFRAEEAYEFNNFEKAEKLFTKIVSNDRNNPDSWIIYTIYFLKISEIDKAIESCREAIRLCSRHKIA